MAFLLNKFNEAFPAKKARMSSKDPPFMSPLLKNLLARRNKLLRKGKLSEAAQLQPKISTLIKQNQLHMVKINNVKNNKGSKGWWDMVNKLSGRSKASNQITSILDIDDINTHFQTNTDVSLY